MHTNADMYLYTICLVGAESRLVKIKTVTKKVVSDAHRIFFCDTKCFTRPWGGAEGCEPQRNPTKSVFFALSKLPGSCLLNKRVLCGKNRHKVRVCAESADTYLSS